MPTFDTLWSDGSESPCAETKLCTAPRSLLTSMEEAQLELALAEFQTLGERFGISLVLQRCSPAVR